MCLYEPYVTAVKGEESLFFLSKKSTQTKATDHILTNFFTCEENTDQIQHNLKQLHCIYPQSVAPGSPLHCLVNVASYKEQLHTLI